MLLLIGIALFVLGLLGLLGVLAVATWLAVLLLVAGVVLVAYDRGLIRR